MSSSSQLPDGWAKMPLAAVVEPTRPKVSPAQHAEKPFLGMEQLAAETMKLLGTVPAGSMRSSAVHFQPGDVLYGRLRPYLNKVYQPDFEGLCSAEFIVLPETEAVRGDFLKYRLNSMDFVSFASHLNEGDRPRVDFDQIKSFVILLPPVPEQRRIVEKIEELFSDLDAGMAALERVRRNLKRYRAAVLKAAVEGNLTAQWRKDHRDAEAAGRLLERILAERRSRWVADQLGKWRARQAAKGLPADRIAKAEPAERKRIEAKYQPPAGPDTDHLPDLPDGWCWATVDMLIVGSLGNGISVKGGDSPPGIPALKLNAMSDTGFQYEMVRYLPLRAGEVEDLFVQAGDFFVSRGNGSIALVGRGTLAQKPPFSVVFPDTMIRLCLAEAIVTWVASVWPSQVIRGQVRRSAKTTAGIWKINQQDLSRYAVPLPPLAEQAEILAVLEAKLSTAEATLRTVDGQLRRASRLRQAILKRAFEGRLVPQDLADEPADVLLARIRAERQHQGRTGTVRARKRA